MGYNFINEGAMKPPQGRAQEELKMDGREVKTCAMCGERMYILVGEEKCDLCKRPRRAYREDNCYVDEWALREMAHSAQTPENERGMIEALARVPEW